MYILLSMYPRCCSILFISFISLYIKITFAYYNDADFIRMVRDNITAANEYVLPQNNSRMFGSLKSDSRKNDFGIFDFIIVGGGTAGTLLANRLSEIAEWNILLLEAGGPENDFSDIPGMNGYLLFSDMNWGYNAQPQQQACLGMKNNSCTAPRGKVLGGCSTINGKLFVRGNKEDFNLWEAMGNTGWSYEEVLQYFIKLENAHIQNADPGFHGTNGPLYLGNIEPTIMTDIYKDAMQELGYPWVDYNGRNQIGCSRVVSTIRGNRAISGGRAFIDPISIRPNLNVTLNAFVTRLMINNSTRRADGVEFVRNGRLYQARASREVILSAGAFNSPQILMLSGIGPRTELRKHGIDMIEDLPVGQNLQDHLMFIGLVFRTNLTSYNESLDESILRYRHNHRPLTAGFNTDTVGFMNYKDNASSVPDIEHMVVVPPGWGTLDRNFNLNKESVEAYKVYNPYTDIIMLTILLHEKSRGTITLKSKDPRDFPNINHNLFSDPQGNDIDTLYNGIIHALKLLDTDAFKSVNSSLISVVAGCEQFPEFSKKYWFCALRHLTTTVYHPVGTTRMGTPGHNSVVSEKLIVHGMTNLRVVDAGVMPEITSGNINAATYMIAEKIADDIKLHNNAPFPNLH